MPELTFDSNLRVAAPGGLPGYNIGNVKFALGVFQKIKSYRLCLKVTENLSTVLLTGI